MDSATNFVRDGNELAQQAVVVGLIPYCIIIRSADSDRQTRELE